MAKYIVYVALGIAVICIAAGGIHLCRVYFKNKKEMSKYTGAEIKVAKDFGKVLIVYYSMSGNTRDIAQRIQKKTNADIYEIKTKEPIKKGAKLYMDIKKQIKSAEYPQLQTDFPDFTSYDIIFVGAPVWWYTAATPALSFLEQADFQGKKVVPFSTQGSNVGTFEEDFKAKTKNADILKYEKFNNISKKYDSAVDNKIAVWLNNLDN